MHITGTRTDILDDTTPISFPGCLHLDRKKLLRKTMQEIHKSFAIYGTLPDLVASEPIDTTTNPFLLDDIATKSFRTIPGFAMVSRLLEEAILRCDGCGQGRQEIDVKALKPIADILMIGKRPKRIGGDHGHPSRRFNPGEDEERRVEEVGSEKEQIGVDGAGPEDEEMEVEEAELENEEPLIIKPTQCLAKPQTIPRFTKTCIPAYRPVNIASLVCVRKFKLTHDDYDTGPTAEDSLRTHHELMICFQNESGNFKSVSMMLRFRDHGYRLLPDSLDQFYLSNPTIPDQISHFFPTPPLKAFKEWKRNLSKKPTPEDLLSLDRRGPLPDSCISGFDIVEQSLQDMIANSGPEGSPSSMMAYVTGRVDTGLEESSYIRLDVTRDSVQPHSVDISMDIDSVIWLTRRLRVAGAFNLHTSPYRKKSPPISVANHLYVDLLWPRLEEDVSHGRMSGGVKQVPLSNIPNTHFAAFGRLEGAATVAVLFPRMRHRYPLQNYWETKLPGEVELLWLRNVVYTALHRLDDKGIKPYVDFSYEDTKWKHAGAPETTQVLAHEHLEQLQNHMDTILDENKGNPSYDCFRSYFFVLEIRGIKVPTSSDNLKSKDPWQSLVENYPAFDWAYMEDVDNGELLIDIGFGFHPSREMNVVGFWNVDVLRLSFDYGGYNQGVSHSVCTIPQIGGIQGEMSKARRLMIHIAYRQSYNLAYEVIRGKQTRERTAFFPAELAYHQHSNYWKTVDGVRNAFTRSVGRSYGVRDEYRCRASMRKLFPLLISKVRVT